MRLKIGTFNIAAGLNPATEEIKKVLEQENFTMLGLQEVDFFSKRNPKDMLTEIAGEAYPYQIYQSAFPFSDGGEYGMGVLSQVKPQKIDHHVYQTTGEEPRVFQEVIFEGPNQQKIAFYNTHLSFESPEIRAKQVEELKARILQNNCQWQVIVGDFNFDQTLNEWEVFAEFQKVNGFQGQWFDTFLLEDETMKNFAIDNILVSANFQIEAVGMKETSLSDHGLLWVELDLRLEE
ncbi:endonuclease/exonuclease/phosphatase family protein [Enterococcus sp. LJL98]